MPIPSYPFLCSWRRGVLLEKVLAADAVCGIAHAYLHGVLPQGMLPAQTEPAVRVCVVETRPGDLRVPDVEAVMSMVQTIGAHDAKTDALVGRCEHKRRRCEA